MQGKEMKEKRMDSIDAMLQHMISPDEPGKPPMKLVHTATIDRTRNLLSYALHYPGQKVVWINTNKTTTHLDFLHALRVLLRYYPEQLEITYHPEQVIHLVNKTMIHFREFEHVAHWQQYRGMSMNYVGYSQRIPMDDAINAFYNCVALSKEQLIAVGTSPIDTLEVIHGKVEKEA